MTRGVCVLISHLRDKMRAQCRFSNGMTPPPARSHATFSVSGEQIVLKVDVA